MSSRHGRRGCEWASGMRPRSPVLVGWRNALRTSKRPRCSRVGSHPSPGRLRVKLLHPRADVLIGIVDLGDVLDALDILFLLTHFLVEEGELVDGVFLRTVHRGHFVG